MQCDNSECSAFGKEFRAVSGRCEIQLEEVADDALDRSKRADASNQEGR